ncbi:hypothetical protein [Massilia sp. BJB1822]|uniref:hypothetical protein n=1 Tax=Massilia sp. BJB1822 TaxID=2744470 RepID=UPI0015945BC7|nr:hypothetical protein [Massilia sp. BJB1822]NVD96972.1 hypothetical protein [Massilia sp. BJB1822]
MVNHAEEIRWHYPRKALADAYLETLRAGLISSLVLFAPRRKGKTEFLLEDLFPAAEAQGYLTVYCSMWQNRSDPLASLLLALSQAAKPKTFGAKLQNKLLKPFKKANLELDLGPVGKLKAEAEFHAKGDASQAQLQRLPELIDAVVAASKGKVLIAFDEIQHLAKPEFTELVAALRTTLDVRKRSVKTVFTGSSRNRLQMMFSQIKAPLFQFSQSTDFPDLDGGFVEFMSASFQQATGRTLDPAQANAAFDALSHTPGLFHDAVERLMKMGGTDILSVARRVLADSREASGYAERLMEMRPLDRGVIRAIVARQPLYTEETRRQLAQAVGIEGEPLTARQVQVAVERLLTEQIIYQAARGVYEIEDHQLAEWLLAAPEFMSGEDGI